MSHDNKKPTAKPEGTPLAWVQFIERATKPHANASGQSAMQSMPGNELYLRNVEGHLFVVQVGEAVPPGSSGMPIENVAAVGWK